MTRLMRRLESWWWSVSKPEWDDPEPDTETPQALAAFVAKSKHPPACRGGCQCKPREGGG